jgi:hypothetical protein
MLLTLLAVALMSVRLEAGEVSAFEGTVVSTELIEYSSFSSTEIDTWISLCKSQGLTEFTLRIPAYSDFKDEILSEAYESKTLAITSAAKDAGILVNVDLHTWYTTWDDSFEDAVSGSTTNRARYIAYVQDCITKLDVAGLKTFMVMNEPQAQKASSSENNFIMSVISKAKSMTSKPISVRFMAGYTPTSGHYASEINSACDFLAVNTYWDPRYPSKAVYGTTESKMDDLISTAQNLGKELWITEFGKPNSNPEAQEAYAEGFVNYAKSRGIDRIFLWVAGGGVRERYNILTSDLSPRPAFNLLGSIGSSQQTDGLIGDLNGDKIINLDDITLFIDAYIASKDPISPIVNPAADLNFDGNVDLTDITAFIDCYINYNTMQ